MNPFLNFLYLSLIGTVNIATPLLAIIAFYPAAAAQQSVMLLMALAIGLYLAFITYRNTVIGAQGLIYAPTGAHQTTFEAALSKCMQDHTQKQTKTVRIRYGYSYEGIAVAYHDTVALDPLIWTGVEDDPAYQQAHQVVTTHIVPTLTSEQKARITAIRATLTPAAQRFIFKHEIGHIVHQYTYKKIAVISVVGALATYSGLVIGWYLFHTVHCAPISAIILGMLAGATIDLFGTYLSNLLFKLRAEIAADSFAATLSTAEEIKAAATFFEQHQQILNTTPDLGWNPLTHLPATLRTGHPNGTWRAQYLRKLAQKR